MAIVRIQLRRDTAANWTSANPVLAAGEVGLETNTNQLKIGNGTTAWSSLPYGGIQGPQGPAGTNGTNGANGADGLDGVASATAPLTYNPTTHVIGINLSQIVLDNLGDVVISSPLPGQAITYNGTNWVNSQPQATGETISSFLLMGA